jgi:indole-3-glycerol phosphate synthase
MSDILGQIVRQKRQELAAAIEKTPRGEVRRQAHDAAPARDFFGAVTRPAGRLRVIAEVKRASPSAGLIRADFDPVALARAYKDAGAAAVSCLTDEYFFQGSLAYLAQIRRAVDIPLLRKDFILDEYQVYQARAAGADAVLLIAECLEESLLVELLDLAGDLGLTALVEVHDVESLLKVRPYLAAGEKAGGPASGGCGTPGGGRLLGINNRDLRTMQTDLCHTLRLLELVEDHSIVVSESGIRTPADVARLHAAGVDRILVGEQLMRQPDVGAALRELMGAGGEAH